MADDLHVIRKIEKSIGQTLEEVSPKAFLNKKKCYVVENGRVVGLNLFACNLTDISTLRQLTMLKTLNLENNKITRLPGFITQWDMEINWKKNYNRPGINLYGNPLEIPPVEIAKQGVKAVCGYFTELEKETALLLQAKLIFVGSGGVGKTTLMKILTEPDFRLTKDTTGKERTTHGLRVKPWKLTCPLEGDTEPSRELTLHTWDFGDLDIYRSTHRFFLSKRALYILVWEAGNEEAARSLDYWLNVIKRLSDNSPVIVVMNKADVRGKPIDEVAYTEKFGNIAAFLQVSCLDRSGIDALHRTIRRVLGGMPHLKDKLPKVWKDIRDELERQKENYIDADRYYGICREFKVSPDSADHISDFLHDLGLILRFRTDPLLKNTLILTPQWAARAVYKLIDSREIRDKGGRFAFDDLEGTWDPAEYPADKHPQLVRLMEKFELCFNLTGTTTYIIPQLLPGRKLGIEISYLQAADILRFQYRYDFMPEGIVSRFIARNYFLILEEKYWKNGAELEFDHSRALLLADTPGRKLRIWVRGRQKTQLLAIIRNQLNHIHTTLNLKKEQGHYKELVACNCPVCSKRDEAEKYFFPFDVIEKMAERGKSLTCLVSYEDVSPDVLLRGGELPGIKKTLLESLLAAASRLQGLALTIRPDEASRTGLIALLLRARNYLVQENVHWGSTESGRSPGMLDIVIDQPDGKTAAVVEAFNLRALNRTVISHHISRIFGYDPNGLPENFFLVYVETPDFTGLWSKYLDLLSEIDYPFKRVGAIEDVPTGMNEIKCAYSIHRRGEEDTRLYHLFINLGSQIDAPGIAKPGARTREVFLSETGDLFTTLNIKRYKAMVNLTIRNLERINIFAGINNSGKSTLLEAVYLLIGQNDPDAFLETMRRRGKYCGELNPQWLMKQFTSPIELEGIFHDKPASLRIDKEAEEKEEFDKSSYLGTFNIAASFLDGPLTTKARIFERGDPKTFFKTNKRICHASFSSPFSMQYKEDMVGYHEKSVEAKSLDRIQEFLRAHVDGGIKKIEYVGEAERFLVTHSDFENPMDLTQFGEGMQRAFHISLQFAASRNGVLLIDELENAIHYVLLNDFVAFICELAKEFNTQVFLTSHSKECIEAFFTERIDRDTISAYQLERTNEGINCKYISGSELEGLINSFGADLRG